MKDRTVFEGHAATPVPTKPVPARETVDECRVRDELEDDDVREALRLPHQRKPQTGK